MAQPGIHAITALALRNVFPSKRWFGFGLVFGSLIPDIDVYPMTYSFLFMGVSPDDAQAIYHRTFTHSVFVIAGIAALFYLLSWMRSDERLHIFGAGLALGMLIAHSILDLLIWFDGVVLFWPIAGKVSMWEWFTVPDLLARILRASHFWAYGCFFACLAAMARKAGTNTDYLPRLRRFTQIQLGFAIFFTVLAVSLSTANSGRLYDIVDGAAFLFWAYPNGLWVAWQMRETIDVGPVPVLKPLPAAD